MNVNHPLPVETPVEIDIAQGLAVGTAVVLEAAYDDGWLYHVEVTGGDRADEHRHDDGELWVWDFEVRPLKPVSEAGAEHKEDSP